MSEPWPLAPRGIPYEWRSADGRHTIRGYANSAEAVQAELARCDAEEARRLRFQAEDQALRDAETQRRERLRAALRSRLAQVAAEVAAETGADLGDVWREISWLAGVEQDAAYESGR